MILNYEHDGSSSPLTNNRFIDKKLYTTFTLDQRDIWHVHFCETELLTFENLKKVVPIDILDQIKNKKIVLMLENFDNHQIQNVVEQVYQEVVINGMIPVEQIKLVSCIYDTFYQIAPAAEKFGLAEIEFEYYNYWEAKFKKIYEHSTLRPVAPVIKKSYSKKFVCLIKRYRLERCMLFILLSNRNLLNQGYISFTSEQDDPKWSVIVDSLYEQFPGLSSEIDQLDPDIQNKIPLHLDDVNRFTGHAFLHKFHSSLDMCYASSYFSIVSESSFVRHDHGIIVSEKIIRAIVNRHPFIVVGPDHYLAVLKMLGYKTFDSVIDESYDSETDNDKRLIKVVNEVDRLCKLTGDQLQDFLIKSQEICDYNFQRFVTNSDNYIYTKQQLLCQQFT